MRILVILPDRNSLDKKDWSGAFLPESLKFKKVHDVLDADYLQVNLGKSKPARAKQILDFINDRIKNNAVPIDAVAFFCHGLPRSLPQFGITSARLASVLGSPKRPNLIVILYACSTGDGAGVEGDGGFGDLLRDDLCKTGSTECEVYSHTTAGHATFNPNVRVFVGDGSPVGGTGGSWIVKPFSTLWGKWKAALKGVFRFEFPFMTIAEIHQRLEKV